MKRNWKRPITALFISLAALMIIPAFLPQLPLQYFAPFIIILFYEKSRVTVLWISLLCGLCMDLLSSHAHFGIYALNYCICSQILYSKKPLFFEDALSTIPLFSGWYSFCSTGIQFLLLHLFGKGFPLTFQWLAIDMGLMSFFDASYAFLLFSIPLTFLQAKVRSPHNFMMKRRPQ